MASAPRNGRSEGVEFIHEDDGSLTAVDLETGVASFGDTKSEALAMLADDLEALGLDPDAQGEKELPEFMQ